MSRLVEAGVPCEVFLGPILPGITGAAVSIRAVATVSKAHGAASFSTSALRLAPFVKEHYLGLVVATYPDFLSHDERAFPSVRAVPGSHVG